MRLDDDLQAYVRRLWLVPNLVTHCAQSNSRNACLLTIENRDSHATLDQRSFNGLSIVAKLRRQNMHLLISLGPAHS